jgi:hypothetical protein
MRRFKSDCKKQGKMYTARIGDHTGGNFVLQQGPVEDIDKEDSDAGDTGDDDDPGDEDDNNGDQGGPSKRRGTSAPSKRSAAAAAAAAPPPAAPNPKKPRSKRH